MISPEDKHPVDLPRPQPAVGSSLHESLLHGEEGFRLLVADVRDYAIFLLSPEGIVSTWNAGAEHIKGYAASEIIGRSMSTFYPDEAIARGWPQRELELARQEGRFEDEGWRLRKDGTRFWANVVITAIRDSKGTVLAFLKITRDLTERRRHEESLRQSEERLRLLIEGVNDYAIIMLDPEGYVSSWNVGAERIQGYRSDEIIGRHFSAFYLPEAAATGAPQRALDSARSQGRVEREGWRVRSDGTRFWANVIITPLRDRDGQLRGYAKVTQDMTQRQRVEVLEETGRRMNEFLAMLAHELRNPLAPITNAVALMRARSLEDPTLQWSRDVIARQATHLSRLVDDLLDVSRITSGRLILQKEPVDLGVVIDRAVEASRPLIDARSQALEVRLPEATVWVDGDLIRLTQMVINILNNASKYTPEGGRIWVGLTSEDGTAEVRVRDSGVGIPADLLTRIFDLFTQGSRTLDRSEGGLGIGLTLVQRLATLHGGTVEAQSAGPNRGSEFILRLPAIAATRLAARRDESQVSAAHTTPIPRRILVVDDNRDSTESMTLLIGLWGHQTRSAQTGAEALEIAGAFQPEIVLLDIGLPGMDGYEVARRLRELPGTRGAVLIAMTGYGQEEDRRRTRDAGFAWHFVKPADPAALRRILESLEP